MTAELGSFALVLASGAVAGPGRTVDRRAGAQFAQAWPGAAREQAAGAFLATAFAFFALMWAFVTSDFSVANVAENSHTAKPLLYKIAGVWGSHDGSMLLWCLALTGFGAVIALGGKGLPARLKADAVATQGLLGALFLAYSVFASNPLIRLPNPPVEGASLNPIRQDPFLGHPPAVPLRGLRRHVGGLFKLAIAALIEGRIARGLGAMGAALGVGVLEPAHHRHHAGPRSGPTTMSSAGGGWWAWDPVENASFMPWLAATALLHSAVVTEKRGALAAWTVFLSLMAFTFSMLGYFPWCARAF